MRMRLSGGAVGRARVRIFFDVRAFADNAGEIASRLGFMTIQHFSRVFKEETGQSPVTTATHAT